MTNQRLSKLASYLRYRFIFERASDGVVWISDGNFITRASEEEFLKLVIRTGYPLPSHDQQSGSIRDRRREWEPASISKILKTASNLVAVERTGLIWSSETNGTIKPVDAEIFATDSEYIFVNRDYISFVPGSRYFITTGPAKILVVYDFMDLVGMIAPLRLCDPPAYLRTIDTKKRVPQEAVTQAS